MKKILGALVANALSFYLLDLMFNNVYFEKQVPLWQWQ